MDVIINGIFASKHPFEMKQTFLKRIVENCPSQGANVNKRVFQFCCLVKLNSAIPRQSELADYVLDGWSTTNVGDGWVYLLKELLPNKDGVFANINNSEMPLSNRVYLVGEFLRILHTKDVARVSQTTSSVTWKLSLLHTRCEDLPTFLKMVNIFDTYPIYLEHNGHIAEIIASTVDYLAKLKFSEEEKQDLGQSLTKVDLISKFLGKMISKKREHMLVLMNDVFGHIYDPNKTPSACLAALLPHFPIALVDSIAKRMTKDSLISNERMVIIVGRMIDWIAWPGVKNLAEWIVGVLKALHQEKKYAVICTVIEDKAATIFGYVGCPLFTENAITISSFLLLSYQHDPQVFHKIIPVAVGIFKKSLLDTSPVALSMRHSLTELMYTLMYQFPGFPDVYSELIEILKAQDRPPEAQMKLWLATSKFSGLDVDQSSSSSRPIRFIKSETGKVGLVNLGNTCYMNSVLQAIFMLKRFRRHMLNTRFSSVEQSVSFHLQKLFALLLLSKRHAISPIQFHRVSRPSWFSSGSQQDCSEFLKHLLDCLDQEDSSDTSDKTCGTFDSPSSPSEQTSTAADSTTVERDSIHSMFCGEAAVCTRCKTCQGISCKREAFNDIPLAFPYYTTHTSADNILKGGNLSAEAYSESEEKETASKIENAANLSNKESSSIGCESQDDKPSTSQGMINPLEPLVSVQRLLELALSKETLTASNQYHCDNCGSLQDAERKMTIVHAPHYLILTLKRFTYDVKSQTRSKILQNLIYSPSIDLRIYSRGVADNKAEMETIFSHATDCTAGEFSDTGPPLDSSKESYELCSIVVHSGISSDCGHYYCYSSEKMTSPTVSLNGSKKQITDQSNVSWFMLNDMRTTMTTSEAIDRVSQNFPRDTPYVLIYKNIRSDSVLGDLNHLSIPDDLNAMVKADNKRFQQELQDQERHSVTISDIHKNQFDKDGPGGSCGGPSTGGFGLQGPRFIF